MFQQCSAKSKRTGKRCKARAMHGKAVCYHHGGRSGGPPKGSKNALTTGEFEALFPDCFTTDEQERMAAMDTNALVLLEEEIKITRVRESRILIRISRAVRAEKSAGTPTGQKNQDGKDILHPAMLPTSSTVRTSREVAERVLNSEVHAAFILRLENALTNVQGQLARLIDQKAKLLAAASGEAGKGPQVLLSLNLGEGCVEPKRVGETDA